MTTQEFVKKEADVYSEKVSFQVPYNGTNDFYNEERLKTSTIDFSDGLSKGLEIAKEVLDFAVNKYFSVERLAGKTYWAKSGETGNIQYLTTAELLEIFLTEKYKQ